MDSVPVIAPGMSHVGNLVVVNQQQPNFVFGPIALFWLIAVTCLVVDYFWWIAGGTAFLVGSYLLYCRLAATAQRDARLAAEADYQNQLFLAGDERGIYGANHEGSQ